MSPLLPRFVKVAYRKEPISSFILIVGGSRCGDWGNGRKMELIVDWVSNCGVSGGSAVVAIPKIGSDRCGTTS